MLAGAYYLKHSVLIQFLAKTIRTMSVAVDFVIFFIGKNSCYSECTSTIIKNFFLKNRSCELIVALLSG